MIILDNISNLLKEKNITQKALCEYLGLNQQAYTNWKNRNSDSYKKYLPQIAEYFDVSVDYLLGNTEQRKTVSDSNEEKDSISADLTEQERTLIRMFRETTEEGRFEMIASIVNIKSAIEKKHSGENPGNIGAI